MSIEHIAKTNLYCDMTCCPGWLHWDAYLSKAEAERAARDLGWRKDKHGRNICSAHSKIERAQ